MKIRKRITYTFTLLFGVLILTLCILVYVTSSSSREELFFNRLDDRLKITEEFFLESETFSDDVKAKLRSNFLKTLPSEVEFVDTSTNFSPPPSIQSQLPTDLLEDLSEGETVVWSEKERQGIARIYKIKDVDYIVLVIAEDEYGHAYLAKLFVILLLAFLTAVVVTFFLTNYFSKKVLKPIAGKIIRANNISASNLDLRLTVHNANDELGMLALSFNNLLDRLQTAFELEKNFVRYASHEMKNPLAVILGEAEVTLLKERTPNEYVATIEKIRNKAEKLNSLVNHFLQLSKLESAQINSQKIALDEVLINITFDLTQQYDEVNIVFNMSEDGDSNDFMLEADEQLMQNALYNLVDNACKFSLPGGEVIINLVKLDQKISITIKDEGIGISAEHIGHIFKPLYRGSNAQSIEGTGIGLALVKRIIDLHGGSIHVDSELDKGTEFEVIF